MLTPRRHDLPRLEIERRKSARRALAAQEEERHRVARELHDELGQVLTGVLLLMDEANKAPAQRAAAALEEGREAARAAITEVRPLLVEHVDGEVRMVVGDDGCGFPAPPPDDRGIGGIRERAMLVGGTVEVDSTPGRGTRVVLSIPCTDDDDAAEDEARHRRRPRARPPWPAFAV